MSNLVIYHAGCVDGFTAAWCAWLHFGRNADLVAAHYGDVPPDVTGRNVRIVDFSYPRETLLAMRHAASELRVLDHHKTAQADLVGLDFCTFDMNRSGAGLAWDELLGPLMARPALVDYVEDRDLWRWVLPDSRVISAYIATVDRDLSIWSRLAAELDESLDVAAAKGAVALRVVDQYVDSVSTRPGRTTLAGVDVPIVNTTFATSELVGKLAESAPFAVGWFERGDGKIVYSLRSRGAEGADVSAIAKQFGGGGHRNAAGFTVDRLIHREPF